MNASWEPNESALKKYGRNLTNLAKENKLEPVIGRSEEIRRMIRILSRKTKNNPVLIGEPGVGKTAIVEGLAIKILEGQVPENLKNSEVIELDLASLIAGASYQGEFEKRLKEVLKAVEESKNEIILFIDEIHMLIGTGKTGADSGMDAANIIKPLMARGLLHLIGATTYDEYRKYIEKDAALERRMQKIDINEPSVSDTITILRGIKSRLEQFHKVKIDDDALIEAANLSNRYITDRFLPDKAIDLVDEAAATIKTEMNFKPELLEKAQQEKITLEVEKAALISNKEKHNNEKIKELENKLEKLNLKINQLNKKWNYEKEQLNLIAKIQKEIDELNFKMNNAQNDGNYELASKIKYSLIPNKEEELKKLNDNKNLSDSLIKDLVTKEDIAQIISKWTKIPLNKLLETEKNKLLSMEENLNKVLIDQQEAIKLVSNAIIRTKANINDPDRPLASFLFLGPTGVGKTELARKLAYELFDNEKQMIRLDMSEYMEKHSVSKIIGSPPGYVGYNESGTLAEKIRKNPYTILLLDEIEKAHSEVTNVFLQILDSGKFTDSSGKLVNCKNLIIIMTSNLGASEILRNQKPLKNNVIRKILNSFFKPEFINRIDEIIQFNPLSKESLNKIITLELDKLNKRIYQSKNIKISFDNLSINKILSESYDPEYGARPIKRYIQKNIENLIALHIINGDLINEHQYICRVINNKFSLKTI
ncbi:ATP-dependent Clp protease ATP-binding subunit [Mycoplasma buteonis]|uniref:ATP-dependent Clp protease ATP-binding subunit n=1 Tax=Mycoplasma buteonis TaxID=171280 RepID=UPI00068A1292|nr:AAA family ATPase [Mycoplasma buteonis]